jgi:hypothetical protein
LVGVLRDWQNRGSPDILLRLMADTEFLARGKVKSVQNGTVIFVPSNTNYELYLAGSYDGAPGELIDCVVKARARKIYTVPSGGNFITPIFGPPKIVQGRVRSASDKQLVIHASIPFVIDLPREDSAIDLDEGAITVGNMVNAVLLAGATFELAGKLMAR